MKYIKQRNECNQLKLIPVGGCFMHDGEVFMAIDASPLNGDEYVLVVCLSGNDSGECRDMDAECEFEIAYVNLTETGD